VKSVRFDSYGGTDVLQLVDVELDDPPAGEVAVAVRAAGINPGEASIRRGDLEQAFPTTFPCGEASDLAGVVTAVGRGVHSWAVGDGVLGWTDRRASYAEAVLVPADQLVAKPAGLWWDVAGVLFVVATTAYAAVRAVAAGPGDTGTGVRRGRRCWLCDRAAAAGLRRRGGRDRVGGQPRLAALAGCDTGGVRRGRVTR